MLLTWTILSAAAGMACGAVARRVDRISPFRAPTGVPVTGGLTLIVVWWIAAGMSGSLGADPRAAVGLALATLVLAGVGLWDARRALGPRAQLVAQGLAAGSVVFVGGTFVLVVTHPLGGLLPLNRWMVGSVAFPGALLSVGWIVLLMNAVNFLDGMDGLATSVSTVGFFAIAAVSVLPHVNEPDVALPALLAAGACLGLLFWNLPPARLYLGTSGAWFLGFLLAVLSLEGSSKIATLAVVGAIPVIDAAAVVVSRVRRGASPFRGDRTHLHHHLAARGWSPRAILAAYAAASLLLGALAVWLPTPVKAFMVAVSAVTVIVWTWRHPRRLTPSDAHA